MFGLGLDYGLGFSSDIRLRQDPQLRVSHLATTVLKGAWRQRRTHSHTQTSDPFSYPDLVPILVPRPRTHSRTQAPTCSTTSNKKNIPPYTRKTACSVRAFKSTDIRSVPDNVATPVTAIMPYHLYSSVMIYLIPTASMSAVGPSCLLQPVIADCNSLFPTYLYHILLHQNDTALTTQQAVPVWYRQFWTVCRRQQSDTAMISYLYQAWRCNRL